MAPMELTAFETAQKVKAGELSAREVLESALDRIAAVDGQPGTLDYGELTDEDREKVHAFITPHGRKGNGAG